jgi:hypothetical protein
MMSSFASLIGTQDFSGAVRLLDGEIDELKPAFDATLQRLVQLYLNRGICNQRLQLNRKALKVREARRSMHDMTAKNLPACTLLADPCDYELQWVSAPLCHIVHATVINQARHQTPSLPYRPCCSATPTHPLVLLAGL